MSVTLWLRPTACEALMPSSFSSGAMKISKQSRKRAFAEPIIAAISAFLPTQGELIP